MEFHYQSNSDLRAVKIRSGTLPWLRSAPHLAKSDLGFIFFRRLPTGVNA